MYNCARCGYPLQEPTTQTPYGIMHAQCAGPPPPAARAGFASGDDPRAIAYNTGYGPTAYVAPAEEDVLSPWIIALLYSRVVIPCLWPVVFIARIVLYYQWQNTYPNRAMSLRTHGRISALISLVIWVPLWLLFRSMVQ